MRVVVAPDKFRGTASAIVAVDAIASGLPPTATAFRVPMSDGGEGLLDVFGGPNRFTEVDGPLGDSVAAGWRFDGRRAVIEMARASGLALVDGPDGNDAVAASTYGTGELITAAIETGARSIVVGVGGSATTDGGLGALRAMIPARLRGIDLTVACDVELRFVDAAEHFAPQKGASPAEVALLRRRLERLVDVYRETYGVDVADLVGGGAAGGLAGGLAAVGATLISGFDLVAEHVGLDELLDAADLVVTGEGHLDMESFNGKVVGGMLDAAEGADVPALVVVGDADDDAADHLARHFDAELISLTQRFGAERALAHTADCIRSAVESVVARRTLRP
ncbi:MAG: glycerate kinase [Microthrixaceae bacterium]